MTRKACKRKIYGLVNPIDYAISGARITDDKSLDALQVRELSSLEAMTTGRASMQEWCDLHALVTMCSAAANAGIGPEALDSCKKAKADLIDAARRNEATGRMGLSGPGIQAMRDVIEYHDLQRRSISRSQYEGVIKSALDLTRSNKAMGHGTGFV